MLDEIENRTGALTTADAAEDALVARVPQLGRAGLTAWAQQHCVQLNATPPPSARNGPKKTSVAEHLWGRGGAGTELAARPGASAAVCDAGARAVPRLLAPAATRADRLWRG